MSDIIKNNCKIISAILLSFLVLQVLPIVNGSKLPEEEWHKSYGGIRYDAASQIIQTIDGGYAIAGYTRSLGAGNNDFWLLKTDQNGAMEWNRTYGSEGDDRAYSLVQTNDGYVLVGYSQSVVRGDFNFLLIKTNLSGGDESHKIYGGEGEDFATALVQTPDGGYAIAGYSNSFGNGDYDFVLMKTDAEGSLEWNKNFGGKGDEKALSLILTEDGGFALAGRTISYGSGSYDFWLVKTDKNGTMEWNRTYGGVYPDSAHSIIQTNDGGFALAGDTASYGSGSYDYWFVKTDTNGTMEWNRTYGGKEDDSAYAIIQTNDGGFTLGGYSKSLLSYDFFLIKTDSNGYVQWNQNYSHSSDVFAFSLIQTKNEGHAMAGIIQWPIDYDLFMFKTNMSILDEECNILPIANAGSDETIDIGEYVSFNGTGYDPDGEIISYRWDFDGDGAYDFESNTTGKTTYVYSKEGTYSAYLEVTDNNESYALDMRMIFVGLESEQVASAETSRETWIGIFVLLTILASVTVVVVGRKKNIGKLISKSRFKYLKFPKKFDTWMWYLIFSFVVIVLLKFIISFLFQTPVIYFDEHSYAAIAHDIFHGDLMVIGDVPLTHPYPAGYSYFLAPTYLLGNNMDVVYHGMLLVNAILSTLLMFPVFFIMKMFVDKKLAFLTALLIAILPVVMVHNYLLLSENALYLMFLVSCFLLIKTFNHKKFDWKFLVYLIVLGFSVRFLIMIKTTGFAMLAALFCVVMYKIVKNRDKFSLLYGITLLPSLPAFFQLFSPVSTMPTVGYETSTYINRQIAVYSEVSYFNRFLNIILNEINYFVLMSCIVFMAFTIFLILYWKKIPTEKKEALSIFTLFGLFSIVFLIIITASYIYVMEYAIYTRYVSIGLPVIFMLGVIGMNLFNGMKKRNASLHIGIIFVLLGLLVILFFPVDNYNVVNDLDLVWVSGIRSASVFGVNGFTLFRILLGLLCIFLFISLIIRYVSAKGVTRRKKPVKQKPFIQGSVLLISVMIVSLIMCFPSIDFILSENMGATGCSINEPARWLMNHDPKASIIVEDGCTAFSGGGMDPQDWFFMYAGMYFWFPNGNISVMNRTELGKMIPSGDLDADYILSTHDLTQHYQSVADIYMNLPVASPRRQMQVDWHIYKILTN